MTDCKEYANNHGLLLVGEPIQESKSAKKSGNRPLFSQMLKDIEKGKYDAILAWHPD
ncbi:recombinase family protein, partial [Candidatus Saccharibacteria bacterium]|nr:recombinase family protein [Candidatus Saccharibacteria bacterium]